jgi:hypothetical protein
VYWTVSREVFGFETYSIVYGLAPGNLSMQSNIIAGDMDSPNATYSIILENLQPLTAYYYSVRAENLAGVTFSEVDNFTTQALSTSIIMVMPENTVMSKRVPTTTDTRRLPQSTADVSSASTSTTRPIQTTEIAPSSTQTQRSTTTSIPTSMSAPTTTERVPASETGTVTTGVSTSATVQAQESQSISALPSQRPTSALKQPSPSITLSAFPSTGSQQPLPSQPVGASSMVLSNPSLSQSYTTASTPSASLQSSMSAPSTHSATVRVEQTSAVSPPAQSTAAIEISTLVQTPVATKLPAVIVENSVKVTLAEYDETNFITAVQLNFKLATAEAVNAYCANKECLTVKLAKREVLVVESKDVRFLEISGSEKGVSVLIYVLIAGNEVLDGDSLLASIQNGSDIYRKYNFKSVTAERSTVEQPENDGRGSRNLPAGAIAGIVIAALLITIAVLLTAIYIFFHIRKKGLYKVKGLVDGYDGPVTDRFFEFGSNEPDDEVKKTTAYEEAEGKL